MNNYRGRKKARDFSLFGSYLRMIKKTSQKIVDVLKQKTLKTSFLNVLIQETSLVKSAEASIDSGSTTQEWFQKLLSISDIEILHKFDSACQKVISKCLQLLRDSIMFSKQSCFSSLWYGLYYSINKEKFLEHGGPFSQLPQEIHGNQCGLYMIIENLFKLVEKRSRAEKKRENQNDKEECIDSRNSKITNFVGFAVYALIQYYGSLEGKARVNEEKDSEKEYNEIGTYLRRMRILHEDALLNVDYLKCMYSPHDQMLTSI